MKTLMIILLVFGLAETISNLLHLSKGNREKIGESARKQHQELPSDVPVRHLFVKALLMFILGALFLASSSVYFLVDDSTGILFTLINSSLMSLYGLVQIILYYSTYKVWTSFVVYSVPLIVLCLLL